MIPHSDQRHIFNFATTSLRTFVKHSRHAGSLVLETLQHAYDTHMERAQMRLAPARPRSWREIPHAGSHHHFY